MLTEKSREFLESERKKYELRMTEGLKQDYSTLQDHDFLSISKIEKDIAESIKDW